MTKHSQPHRKKSLKLLFLFVPFLLISLTGCGINSAQSDKPIPAATVTRNDAESRFAKHCLKSDTITEPMLREFNNMPVDHIDGFANGCEMENKQGKGKP